MDLNTIRYYIQFILYNFISFIITFTLSLLVLFTVQGLILSGSYKNPEFPALIGINSAIIGINSPRPKAKESKGSGKITTSKLISFVGSAIIHLEIMIFCISTLISGQYYGQDQLAIYIAMMMTILTIYVSRPKYKPNPIHQTVSGNTEANINDDTELTEFT